MSAALRAAILATGCWLPHAWGRQAAPSLEDALARVRENVSRFETALPDFLCDEKVTSRAVVNGRTAAEVITQSTIVNTVKDFVESREIASINGKKVSKAHSLKGPFIYLGGFSQLLILTFGSKFAPYYDYRLAGLETVEGRSLLAVEFATKEEQTRLTEGFWHSGVLMPKHKELPAKDSGKAWIDPQSMQVVRIESHHFNLPPWLESESVATDYAPVTIDGKAFWLPRSTRAENVEPQRDPKSPAYKTCIALYSNYRKFEASAAIRY